MLANMRLSARSQCRILFILRPAFQGVIVSKFGRRRQAGRARVKEKVESRHGALQSASSRKLTVDGSAGALAAGQIKLAALKSFAQFELLDLA